MTRRVLYMAHPVKPTAEELEYLNIRNALRWLAWLRKSFWRRDH